MRLHLTSMLHVPLRVAVARDATVAHLRDEVSSRTCNRVGAERVVLRFARQELQPCEEQLTSFGVVDGSAIVVMFRGNGRRGIAC